jgi:glyoxylase-like metal-dependent hydrolase (beta-lactamase superfamily II)
MSSVFPGLQGLRVFERGWLSSNNVLLWGNGGDATLVDSGHGNHAAQTVALVQNALREAPETQRLARVLNTHLHSDHCGGNAALQREFGAELLIPPGQWEAAQSWNEQALGYATIGQRCDRFVPHGRIWPGDTLRIGQRRWEVLASPGHDPHSVMLFDATEGVLISADALWENGYGIVFPELEGEPGFDDVEQVLELVATLPVRCVIPGHGAPFLDCAGALQRARALLAKQRANPPHHARQATKVLIKFHLMEERRQSLADLKAWVGDRPMFLRAFQQQEAKAKLTLQSWCEALVAELVARGALAVRDGMIHDLA